MEGLVVLADVISDGEFCHGGVDDGLIGKGIYLSVLRRLNRMAEGRFTRLME
jgi:hypothetical protein